MKLRYIALMVMAGVLGSALTAFADVHVGVQLGFSDQFHHGNRWDYAPYRNSYVRHPWRHPYRPAYFYQPVTVVPAPVYVAPAYVPAPPPPAYAPPSAYSGDYGTDLAALHEKLYRLRAVLQKQNSQGAMSREQYDRFMNQLDGIEHDEHARSYDRGGYLGQEDFADLHRRADQVDVDLMVALGQ
jgi:hypothetical protein